MACLEGLYPIAMTHNSWSMEQKMEERTTARPLESQFVIEKQNRHRYGLRGVEVLASSNSTASSCLRPQGVDQFSYPHYKSIQILESGELAVIYTDRIHDEVVRVLEEGQYGEWRWFCVFRSCFVDEDFREETVKEPTLVISMVTCRDDQAGRLVCATKDLIDKAWGGQEVRIDVCKAVRRPNNYDAESRATNSGASMLELCPNIYDRNLIKYPRPGFSIGPVDLPNCAGTLTAYIMHQTKSATDIYALTNEHVLNGREGLLLGTGRLHYRHQVGEKRFHVLSPSIKDHDATKAELEDKIDIYGAMRDRLLETLERKTLLVKMRIDPEEVKSPEVLENEEMLNPVIRNLKDEVSILSTEIQRLENIKSKAESHNPLLGYTFRTPGFARMCSTLVKKTNTPSYQGHLKLKLLDWGLVRVEASSGYENRHIPQLIQSINKPLIKGASREMNRQASEYLVSQPLFKPLRATRPTVNELYLKSPGRSSKNWMAAKCNDVQRTVKYMGEILQEYCFILADGTSTPSTRKGDSGSIIFDSNFKPLAMVWGGDDNDLEFGDVTCATPIVDILSSIEKECGWAQGSVSLL